MNSLQIIIELEEFFRVLVVEVRGLGICLRPHWDPDCLMRRREVLEVDRGTQVKVRSILQTNKQARVRIQPRLTLGPTAVYSGIQTVHICGNRIGGFEGTDIFAISREARSDTEIWVLCNE